MKKYIIDHADLKFDWHDLSYYKGYFLSTEGDNVEELLENSIVIYENVDGDVLDRFTLDDLPSGIYIQAMKKIESVLQK